MQYSLLIGKQEQFRFKSPKENLICAFDDLLSFHYVASYGAGKNTGYYSFGDYRFCKFIFKDNIEVIITCLMVNNIQNNIESLLGIKADKKLKIFAFIK